MAQMTSRAAKGTRMWEGLPEILHVHRWLQSVLVEAGLLVVGSNGEPGELQAWTLIL